MQKKSLLLPKFAVPVYYKLWFKPDFSSFTFEGTQEVILRVDRKTKTIIFHASELTILEVNCLQGKKEQKGSVTYNKKNETVLFTFSNFLHEGKAILKIAFTGILNDKMRGFYKSSYTENGKQEFIATTQFESTDARLAFPCIDEPAVKAVFEVTLTIPNEMSAISNTLPVKSDNNEDNTKTIRFSPTPKMSTYLLAFIVGKFEYIETKTKDGIIIRVYVTPGKKEQAEFALDVAVKTFAFYQEYFGVPYPLSAMQLIAIPDFAAGAMENWGAVTYRETAVLVDPKNSSTANKQWVALVIAHELAHQWFGNLVTMEWWTHLWLNEGFAVYIEYLAIDRLFPKWDVLTQFVFMEQAKAFELDGLKNTHPIEVPVWDPAEISEIFDAVSYSKGATVIRMLSSYLGEKVFQRGLTHYLKKYAYSNASTENLWESFEQVSKKPIKVFMKQWTSKPGYPLLLIEEKDKNLKLSQHRFFSSALNKNLKDTTKWNIPIHYQEEGFKNPKKLSLTSPDLLIKKPKGWYKFNTGNTTFMRVSYPDSNLVLLDKPIRLKELSAVDRFSIVSDAFAFSQAGVISIESLLRLVLSYTQETDYAVWAQIASGLHTVEQLFVYEPWFYALKAYQKSIFGKIGKSVGWKRGDDEPHTKTLLRSLVLSALGKAGDSGTIKKAQDSFIRHVQGKEEIEADLRGMIYGLVAQNGSEREYNELYSLYKKENLQEEKDRILRALCTFESEELLRKTIVFGFSDSVRAQDTFRVVTFIWANPKGRDIAWEYVQKKWEEILKKFYGGHLITRFIQPAENFTEETKAEEVEKFFTKHSVPGLERTVAQAVEQIRSNAAWKRRDYKMTEAFLQEFKKTQSAGVLK